MSEWGETMSNAPDVGMVELVKGAWQRINPMSNGGTDAE